MNVKEITLSTGTIVRARPVPPLLAAGVINRRLDLRDPVMPLVEIKGVAGVEVVPARPGEQVYEEWLQKRAETTAERNRLQDDFIWAYGIVSWKLPGTQRFTDKPPAKWVIPQVLQDFGITPRTETLGRKLDYIQVELLQTPGDVESAQGVILGDITEITDQEVDTIVDTFPGDTQSGSTS
jgi:hypothetical protein